MSNSVEDRVVSMKFDNAQFENGIRTTLASLDALNKGLKLEGATKGLTDLSSAGKNVHLEHIASAVDGIAQRFQSMSIVAITALTTIAHQAITTGASLVKSLTIDPLKSGLTEYETNLNSIQTILANTQAANVGLEQVSAALQELNLYSDQTIYNFSEMARNIGTFTAAGVALTPAVAAIKGIANLAALSGSNSMQAATAMYQLSQAISSGTVKLIDWNSVVNAGMGGTVFQRALAQTAIVMGKLSKGAVTLSGDMKTVKIDGDAFRNSLEKGWLTADVLTKTLSQFTGDLKDAELAAMGFNATQIAAIQKQAATAKAAATEVKTITQLMGALRESAGSGWAKTWELIFGNFTEAKELFSSVYRSLNDTIGGIADARNNLLEGWKDLGGRTVLIEAFTYAINALGEIITPIRLAFRDIFPAATAEQLFKITVSIRDFFYSLKQGEGTMANMRRTWAGVFAVLGIGWEVVKQVARVFFELFGVATKGSGGILEFTGSIGDFLVALHSAIKNGDDLTHFFDNLGRILVLPIKLLKVLGNLLGKVFANVDTEAAAQGVVDFIAGINPMERLADVIVSSWTKVISLFGDIFKLFAPLSNKLASWFRDISSAIGGINFDSILKIINTGALATFVYLFHKMASNNGISGIISGLTSSLSAMQHALNAAALLEIAISLGVLAIAILALSKIDAEALARAMSAIAIMFTQLLAAMAILTKMPSTNVIKIYIMAAAMTVLGIAINILALAVKQLSDLSWEELAKGLAGTVVLLTALIAAANVMPDSGKMIATGLGLLILSAAIRVLVTSVQALSGMDWEELSKGLTGVAGLLAALTLFTRFAQANATGVLAGAGIVLLAVGIKILASAVMDLSSISWENIGKGMAVLATSLALIGAALYLIPPTAPITALGIIIVAQSLAILSEAIQAISGISWENVGKGMAVLATSLALIGAALYLIPPTAPLSAAGVLIVAYAVTILAKAIESMGNMDWGQIVKGLVTLAGALAIISGAMYLMTGALPGALALLIVSGALLTLSTVLKILGNMEWGEIVKGLVALAAVFVVLGVAGAILGPVVPVLLGLGLAIALIGGGLALAGSGVFLFAAGLTALSVAGAAGAAAIVAIISAVIGLIPALVQQVGIALLLLVDVLIEGVPKIVELIISLILQLFDGLDKILPKLAEIIVKLIILILVILETAVPRMAEAGLKILIGVLEGIRNNIGKVAKTVSEIVENFLRALGNSVPKVIQAGVDMILGFIRGMTKAIDQNSEALGKAGGDLGIAIVKGMIKGLNAGIGQVANAAKNVAKSALNSALDFLGIASPSKEFEKVGKYSNEGFALGLDKYAYVVKRSAENLATDTLDTLKDSLRDLSSVVGENVDLTPTITPVLDLSVVKRTSKELWSMMDVKPIRVDGSYSSAREAEASIQDSQDQTTTQQDNGSGDTFNFTQNNTSPKALSTADIYRNTKNQLSTAKGVLTT